MAKYAVQWDIGFYTEVEAKNEDEAEEKALAKDPMKLWEMGDAGEPHNIGVEKVETKEQG